MNKDWYIPGLIGFGIILAILAGKVSGASGKVNYSYNATVSGLVCKNWQYIESQPYKIVLNNGDSISLNVTYNISPTQTIDIADVRFHNICSTSEGYGKLYAYVNGKPALPTIGIVSNKTPIYLGFPVCQNYGTVFTTVWDTDDVKGNGTYNYTYVYEGNTPLYVKSLELYVTSKV